jgi:integrase
MASVESRNGKWMVRWRVHGKPRSKTFKTRREALTHKSQIENDLVIGRAVHAQAPGFREWAESWNANRLGLRETTRVRNTILMNTHLLPHFGGAKLEAITQPQVQAFVSGLDRSPATVKEIYQELKKCLDAAVAAKYLRDSPCVGITLPKIERQEELFLTQEQVHSLAESILPRYRALIYTLAFCGLRIGEAAALKPGSINLAKASLKVTESVSEVQGKQVTTAPKTKAGRREIPLPDFMVEVLTEHMAEYPSQYVFIGRQGGQIRANAFRQRAFKNAKKKAGVPPELRIHDLRHTAASIWISNGVDLLRVKKWMGHTSATFTLDRYGHLYEDDNAAILGSLNEAISKSRESG